MKLGNFIVSIQLYYILCLFYFMLNNINEDTLNSFGDLIFSILFNSSPIFILVPFIYFFITKKVDYKRKLKYILICFFGTIFFFEFIFKA